MKKTLFALFTLIILLASLSLTSALVIDSVSGSTVLPGETTSLSVEIENNLQDDVDDVSFSLDLSNLPLTSVGSTEDSVDEIEEDDDEIFGFKIKANNDATPGDYNLPYTLTYKESDDNFTKTGTIGLTISASTELSYSASTENNILDEQGKVTLKIVNTGFADLRFVSVKLLPQGLTLLSENEEYIGTVDSDDFETATFDVIFNSRTARLKAQVEYKDFDNNKILENVDIPLIVYTQEKAIELGIKQKDMSLIYTLIVVILIIIWLIWRAIKKRRRLRRSREGGL